MGEYFQSREQAEKAIKVNWSSYRERPVLFARIQHGGGEKWIVDYDRRDLGGAAFKILENLSHTIPTVLAG